MCEKSDAGCGLGVRMGIGQDAGRVESEHVGVFSHLRHEAMTEEAAAIAFAVSRPMPEREGV